MATIKSLADKRLSQAYREYGAIIERYCRVRLGDAIDATDDCVQETFCVYYKMLINGETVDNVRAFLYRTADNMVKRAKADLAKKAVRTVPIENAESIEAHIADEQTINTDYDRLKEILLSRLNQQELELYRLKYEKRLSLKEIGIILNIPPTTVANRTSRLRTKIKALTREIIDKETFL